MSRQIENPRITKNPGQCRAQQLVHWYFSRMVRFWDQMKPKRSNLAHISTGQALGIQVIKKIFGYHLWFKPFFSHLIIKFFTNFSLNYPQHNSKFHIQIKRKIQYVLTNEIILNHQNNKNKKRIINPNPVKKEARILLEWPKLEQRKLEQRYLNFKLNLVTFSLFVLFYCLVMHHCNLVKKELQPN